MASFHQAERALALAQTAFSLAQENLKDAEARARLGLISPLELAQTSLKLYQAQASLAQAELSKLQSILNFYTFYAEPPVEVLP
jgi:outer membrane protein